MSEFHALKVIDKKQETPHAVSIALEVPSHLIDAFSFVPGQYLTFQHFHNGEEMRRSYSLCSASNSNEWRVGIKKVEKGVFSEFANDTLQIGDSLNVMTPDGHFVLRTNASNSKNYFAFAAGSGITPVLSMIKSVIRDEPQSTFTLAYGNQSVNETMFHEELEDLRNSYPERFFITYFYSRQNVPNCLFGRIERSMVLFLLKNTYKDRKFDEFFLCGPEPMILEAKDALIFFGYSESNIHFELFTSSVKGELKEAHDGQTQVTIILDDEEFEYVMPQEKSVLQAALDEGLDAPYSCQGGICSSCIARVKEGKVEMRKNQILTDKEVADGYVLTCQSHPTTTKLVIDYDDV